MNDVSSLSAERISALVDGQLEGEQFAQVVTDLVSDPDFMQTWLTYHIVGDVLRSVELAPSVNDLGFLERFEHRLTLAEGGQPQNSDVAPVVMDLHRPSAPLAAELRGANDGIFRWRIGAGAACVVISGVIGFTLWNQSTLNIEAPLSIAPTDTMQKPLTAVDLAVTGVMIRDPRLDELLLAHRQLAGHSALQMPAGFLRNATFEGSAR